jgi:hypothetical protein
MDDQVLVLVEKITACTVRIEEAAKRLDSHDKDHDELRRDVEALKRDKWKAAGFLAAIGVAVEVVRLFK